MRVRSERDAEGGALVNSRVGRGRGICRWNSEGIGRKMWRRSREIPSQDPKEGRVAADGSR